MRSTSITRILANSAWLAATVLILHTSSQASGSSDKSPEATAVEQEQKAIREYNRGVDHMEKAREIAEKGDSAFAYNYRATADAKAAKEYQKAIKRFEKATALQPGLKEAHNNLGYCFRKIGKPEESLAAYAAALAIDSMFAQAREYRAETFLALNRWDDAQMELDFLTTIESPYADTLKLSMQLYKLKEVESKMEN